VIALKCQITIAVFKRLHDSREESSLIIQSKRAKFVNADLHLPTNVNEIEALRRHVASLVSFEPRNPMRLE
jgi:hypothetical protein